MELLLQDASTNDSLSERTRKVVTYDELDSLPGVTKTQIEKLNDSKIIGNEWTLIQALRRVLERFYEATKMLSGQKYPTLSLAYAIIFSLMHYLNNRSADLVENEITDMLLESYNQYMVRNGKDMALIRVSALLDPLTHDLMTPEDKQAAESFILKEVMPMSFQEEIHFRNADVNYLSTKIESKRRSTLSLDMSVLRDSFNPDTATWGPPGPPGVYY